MRASDLVVVGGDILGQGNGFSQLGRRQLRLAVFEVSLSQEAVRIGRIWVDLRCLAQFKLSRVQLAQIQVNDPKVVMTAVVFRIQFEFSFKLAAGLGKFRAPSLPQIDQPNIGMRARMFWLECQRLLEFADCLLVVSGLPVGPANQHVQLGRGAHRRQHLIENRECVLILLLLQVDKRQAVRGVEIRSLIQCRLKLLRGRGEVALFEINPAQQVFRPRIFRSLRQRRLYRLLGFCQLSRLEHGGRQINLDRSRRRLRLCRPLQKLCRLSIFGSHRLDVGKLLQAGGDRLAVLRGGMIKIVGELESPRRLVVLRYGIFRFRFFRL